jgi:hypothetical protein
MTSTYRLATPFSLGLLVFLLVPRRTGVALGAGAHGLVAAVVLGGIFLVDGHVICHTSGQWQGKGAAR